MSVCKANSNKLLTGTEFMGAGCGNRRACCHRGHVHSGTVYIDNSSITCTFIVTARGGGVFDNMLIHDFCLGNV